jgi:hypothetical protein
MSQLGRRFSLRKFGHKMLVTVDHTDWECWDSETTLQLNASKKSFGCASLFLTCTASVCIRGTPSGSGYLYIYSYISQNHHIPIWFFRKTKLTKPTEPPRMCIRAAWEIVGWWLRWAVCPTIRGSWRVFSKIGTSRRRESCASVAVLLGTWCTLDFRPTTMYRQCAECHLRSIALFIYIYLLVCKAIPCDRCTSVLDWYDGSFAH